MAGSIPAIIRSVRCRSGETVGELIDRGHEIAARPVGSITSFIETVRDKLDFAPPHSVPADARRSLTEQLDFLEKARNAKVVVYTVIGRSAHMFVLHNEDSSALFVNESQPFMGR
jgi:hypothetical protein